LGPWAQIIIPIRSLILTVHIVQAAAAGRLELLMLLSGMIMSPFFFLGLRAVRELKIEHLDSRTNVAMTISVGVALIEPTQERSARGALQLADQALYGAKKKKGRNRVELMSEAEHALLTTGIFSINPAAVPMSRRIDQN